VGVTSPVSWETAERVATWVGTGRPLGPLGSAPGHRPLDEMTWSSLRDDFAEATTRAEELVVEATGLSSAAGPAVARVVDRPEWVQANVVSFRRLLDPALSHLQGASLPGPLAAVTQTATGAQLGLVLGWMATRVLGQYDMLFAESADTADNGGMVSYVGPNIVALERRHAFPPRQFRMWIALHEVTHRCQFTGVPWLRGHFLSLVDQGLGAMTADPRRYAEALGRAGHAVRSGRNPLEDAGLLGLVAPPEQLEVIARIQAMMSLLEGHGDVTMDRVGAEEVPDAAWFSRVLHERRKNAGVLTRMFMQLVGLEAKMRQYEQGEKFIGAVEAAGGPELFDRVWECPENLPSIDEIRRPDLWVARLGSPTVAAG